MEPPASEFISCRDTRLHHPPSDPERKSIQEQVIEPCTHQLKALDQDIASLKEKLQILESRHKALSIHIDHHRALISPIRRLPSDVLSEIFVHCLPTNHFAIMNTLQPPLLLCRICSNWRQIAMSTPQLWASIHIPYSNQYTLKASPDAFTQAWNSRLANIDAWLARSGSLPLSISFYDSHTGYFPQGGGTTFIPTLVDLLLSVKHRWKRIQLILPSREAYIEPILSLNPEDVPHLESLGLLIPQNSWNPMSHPRPIFKAPGLRNVMVRPVTREMAWLSYDRLTSLVVSSDSWDAVELFDYLPQILTQCRNLVECSISFQVLQRSDGLLQGLPQGTFPELQTLELDIEGHGFEVLSRFRHMPKLKHLILAIVPTVNRPSTGLIQGFLELLPPLESLVLTYLWLPVEEIVEGLRSQVTLLALTLKNARDTARSRSDTRELLDALTVDPSRKFVLLPGLTSFTHIDSIIRDQYYKKFLVSRTGANLSKNGEVSTLQHVHITFRRTKRIDLLSELSGGDASTDGLNIEIGYPQEFDPSFLSSFGLPKRYKGFSLESRMEIDGWDMASGRSWVDGVETADTDECEP